MVSRGLFAGLVCLVMPFPLAALDALSSAGRIEKAGSLGTCSAALVAADLAVTAAHCIDPDDLRQGAAPQVFFRPSVPENAPPLAVVSAVRHPLYAPARGGERWRFPFDLALVRLARGLPERVNPPLRGGGVAEPGERLTLVSWRGDQPGPVHRPCAVLPGVSGMMTLGCDVRGGESGGAVLRLTEEGAEIVGVLTSRAQIGALPVGQASPLDLRLGPMLRLID